MQSLQCRCTWILQNSVFYRQFSSSSAAMSKKKEALSRIRVPSKKMMAVKAQRRALKTQKKRLHEEKMTLEDAIAVLRAVEVSRPNAAYELVIKCRLDRGMAIPRGRINLPRDTGAKRLDKILVFAEGRAAEAAKKAGADIVGGPELADGIISGRHQASIFLCTPALFRGIAPKLGRVLGPRGLMPSERRGTVTDDIPGYIRRLQGTSEWRGDKDGTIRTVIGQMYFPIEDVIRNIRAFVTSVKRATGNLEEDEPRKKDNTKPVIAISRIILSSVQGPGIELRDM